MSEDGGVDRGRRWRERQWRVYTENADSGTQVKEGTCGIGKPRAESKGKSGCSGLGLREDGGASHQGGKEGQRSQVSKAMVHFGAPEQVRGDIQRR